MIKAELEYNPYLLETTIKFNGQAPRINSLVEKYEYEPLRNWINKIPSIFYDEMNGYDFELEFSGTERDYKELKTTFENRGICEGQVRIFHKNILDSRKEKNTKIEMLLKWLEDNENAHFDFAQFKRDNDDLLEGLYPFIIINGHGIDISAFENTEISVELIDAVEEVTHTALEDTPILINVAGNNYNQLASIVTTLSRRDDVKEKQLFFMVEKPLSRARIERILIDIGIEHPQIVSKIDDEIVLRYLELYPYSDYIHDVLVILRKEIDEVTGVLEEENREKSEANREVYDKLEKLDEVIDKLKRAEECFENDYNNEMPEQWGKSQEKLLNFVKDWKIKKTNIKRLSDAQRYASEFYADVSERFAKYIQEIDELYKHNIDELSFQFKEWYYEADYQDAFDPEIFDKEICIAEGIVSFEDDLMDIKSEQYVYAKEGLIEKLFKESGDDNKEMMLETTFYLQEWRDYVYGLVEPLAKKVMTEYFNGICNYKKQIVSAYIQHLSEEILKKNDERDIVSSQLSDDEKKLQDDNDWVKEFEDKLRNLERC